MEAAKETAESRAEKEAKAAEELRLKETVKAKLVRQLGEMKSAVGGSERKRTFEEVVATVMGLKTEETVGESDAEVAKAKAAKEAEKERKAEEHKAERAS